LVVLLADSRTVTRLEVKLLGPFGVLADGKPVDVSAGRSSALLAVLAMSAGKVVSIERLADMVWGEDLPANARRSVQTYVTRLRSAIGGETITTAGAGYVLNLEPENVDALRFLQLLDHADADPSTERDRVAAALELWRGNPLEGVQSAWLADYERPRLVERYLSALERRIDLDIAAGRANELVAEVRDVAGQHPLRESIWARLIVVLDRCGRQAEALESYETIRSRIAAELGVDPGPELQRIYANLLQGTPPRSDEPPAASPGPAPDRLVPRQLPADIESFAGRDDALAALDGLIDGSTDAADLVEQPVVITALHGAGGIGKTTLAVHWAHRVADRFPDGQLYLNLRGFGPGDPMAPAEALEVLLRGLGVPADQVPADIDARSALLRTVLADRRVLMLLDNARDAEQVRPLLPGGGGALVMVTSRSQLRGLAAREGAGRVAVDTLSLDDATAMLAAGLEGQRVAYDGASLAELAELCGCLPLALAVAVERAGRYPDSELSDLILELRDEHERLDALDTGDDPLTSVRAVFSWSYQALDEDTAETFRLVGRYLGTDFALPAVAALAGLTTGRARRLLDALTDVNLLRRTRHGRYAMHDLLRAYAAELPASGRTGEDVAIRRLISWYVHSTADASTKLSADRDPRFMEMGEPEPGIAPLSFADGRQARDWFDAEWLTLTRVVSFAAEHGEPVAAYRLVNKLYNYIEGYRPPAEAITLQQIGREAAASVGHRADEGFITNQLGISYGRLGDYERCIEYLEQAKERFQAEQHLGGEQMVLINLGIAYRSTGRHDEALQNLQRALQLRLDEEHGGDTATVLVNISRLHLEAGRPGEAVETAARAVEELRGKNRWESEAIALETLGMAQAAHRAYPEAEKCFREALDVHRQLGRRWREAVTLAQLGRVERDTERLDAARDSWQQALAILDEIGEMDSTDLSRAELVELIESA
jgi:DNA-binding SARP family transcriptional activator/tetratricopeptide (TPR) repeat protein